MVKKLVVIADDEELWEIFYALEITDVNFEIVKLYSIGELKDWNGIPIEGVEGIEEIVNLEYDFILNMMLGSKAHK